MMRSLIILVAGFSCCTAFAEDIYGYFCTAEGSGIWAGATRSLSWQTSRVPQTPGQGTPEAILSANEQTAAVFPLVYQGRNRWHGVSTVDPSVSVDMIANEGGSAVFFLTDGNNRGVAAYGSCDTTELH